MSRFLSSLTDRGRRGILILATAGLLGGVMTVPGQGQGNDLAGLQVRVDQLEEQVRLYNGQIEGLQFQVIQLHTLLERIQEDIDFRLQQLEGGAPGEADAAMPSGQEGPISQLPQDQAGVSTVIDPLVGDSDLIGDEEIGGDDELYASDVFGPGGVILGPPEGELGATPPSQPLDLSFDPDAVPLEDGDANAQYQAGYDAVVRGEYAFAENQFRQYLDLFPDHGQAPDAAYWLGQTLIERTAHGEAAEVLLGAFESYPTSTRAPDLLFSLGVALHGAGEFDTACRTYGEVLRRYTDSTEAFRDRVVAEQARAGC